jgi:hypothetical protein
LPACLGDVRTRELETFVTAPVTRAPRARATRALGEDAAELESVGRIVEGSEEALPVLDRQGDERRLSIKRGVQKGRRRLVDKVREYLHEFVADGDAGELRGRDGIGRLLLVAFAREGAVERRIPRCRGVPRPRCPIDLLVVVFEVVCLVDFRFVAFDVVRHGAHVPPCRRSETSRARSSIRR